MSVLSWGKCTIQYATSTNGAPGASATWNTLDTPKEDSTKITANAGNEVEATEEGGALVDFRRAKNTFDFETILFVKKGVNRPFSDTDGIIAGEYALRIVPEDDTCEGIQIDRCVLSVEENYTAADGKTLTLKAKILKPATGNQLKPYTANPSTVTVTVSCTQGDGTVTIDSETASASVSKSVSTGTSVTLKATAASGKTFSQWSDGNTEDTRTLYINATTTLTATFATA